MTGKAEVRDNFPSQPTNEFPFNGKGPVVGKLLEALMNQEYARRHCPPGTVRVTLKAKAVVEAMGKAGYPISKTSFSEIIGGKYIPELFEEFGNKFLGVCGYGEDPEIEELLYLAFNHDLLLNRRVGPHAVQTAFNRIPEEEREKITERYNGILKEDR